MPIANGTIRSSMEDIVGVKEVAQMLGISRQRVNVIVQSHPDFPEPIAKLAAGRVWQRRDIVEWAKKTGRLVHER